MHFAPAPGTRLQRGIGDEAERQAVGNRVGERHRQRTQRRRHRFGQVAPVHFHQFAQHQAGHEQQGRRGGIAGHHRCQRREQQRGQKQRRHHQCGQAGAAAHLHAGGAFGKGRGAAGAEHRAGHDRGAVGQQRTAEALLRARQLQQASAADYAIQGTGGIEHFHQHEHQHHLQKYCDGCAAVMVQQARQVQLQEGRRQARRQRDQTLVLHVAQRPARTGHRQDADQDRAADAARFQHRDQQEAGQCQQRRRRVQRAQCHQRVFIADDHARLLQRDDRQEQADAGHDGRAQR